MFQKELKSFLFNENYFINITDKYIHINNFKKISVLNKNVIEVDMEDISIIFNGENFVVVKLLKSEMLLTGKVKGIKFE